VRKDKTLPHHPKEIVESAEDKFAKIMEDLLHQWAQHSLKNNLNKFILTIIPEHAKGLPTADYVNNIMDISLVEQKLDIYPMIFAPSSSVNNPNGWLVASSVGENIIWTPTTMPSEAQARSLHVLIYLFYMYFK
jgi:hypothetical protein